MPQITLADQCIFQLKFYLDMLVLHTMTAKWLKKKQHGFSENFGDLQKFGKFLKLGAVLILCNLLTDFLLKQTKKALV